MTLHVVRRAATFLLGVLALLVTLPFIAQPAAAATLTFGEKPDRWVVQRQDRGSFVGDLAVSGTVSGPAAVVDAGVEARVVAAVGGDEIVGWTLVDSAPAGGAWTGLLTDIPQGGWYLVETRLAAEPTTTASAVGRFGVGLVVAAIGQSNMVKMFTEDEADGSLPPPFATPDPLTRRYGYGEPAGYTYSRPRTVDVPVSWGEVTGTGGIRLAGDLVDELGVPVLMLDFALDWTGLIDHWDNDLHRSWLRFSEALDLVGEIGVVVWHQGAYDAHETLPTLAGYKAGLDLLYQRITDRVGGFGTLPMLVSIQNRGVYDQLIEKDERYNIVRRAQLEWIDENAFGFAAGATIDFDISSRPGTGNGHFWASEYQEMADRFARGILHALGQPGYEDGLDGARVASALVRGTRVVVEVAHDHGSRLQVPNPTVDVEGFTLTDGEWLVSGPSGLERNELTVVSARLSDALPGNWVELELASAPTGPLRLRYLYGQNPFYSKATDEERRRNGNTLFDDFLYHPERSGLPVHGTVLDVEVVAAGAIVTEAASLGVPEGGSASLGVSLIEAPGGSVTVTASLFGDSDLALVTSSLDFDDGNWSVPQPLGLSAALDADTDDGTAVLRLTAPGQQGTLVDLFEQDADAHLEVTPASLVVSRAGGLGTFEVTLGTAPAGSVTLDLVSGDPASLDVTPSSVTFGPSDWQTPRTLTVEGLLSGDVGEALAVNVTVSVDDAVSDASYHSASDVLVEVNLVGLDDGLIVHWPLDETGGTVATDLSGNGHHGLIGGDVVLGVGGVYATAMTSTGPGGSSGSSADGIAGPSLAGGVLDELSVAFWYRVPPTGADGYLFTWGGSYDRVDTVSLYMDTGGEIRVRAHDSADSTSIVPISPAGFDDQAWHHLALVKDSAGSRVFLDGELQVTSSAGDGAISPASGITLGTNEFGKYGLETSFDDLRVYGRALGNAEVAGLVALGAGTVRVDLQPAAAVTAGARWRLAGEDLTWHESGERIVAPAGEQVITFDPTAGWLAPPDQSVSVAFGAETSTNATFVEQGTGTLSVSIKPPAALTAGAEWQITGEGFARSSGELVSLVAGDYQLTFTPIAGWLAPAPRTVTVVEGVAILETVYYIDEATADPIVHLPLDETVGGLAADVTGNGHDGAFGGDVLLGTDGLFGTAATTQSQGGATGAFDDGLRVASLAGEGYDQLTLAFWYRLASDAHDGYLMTWGGSYNDPNHLSVFLDVPVGLRVRMRDGGDTSSIEQFTPPGFDDTSWHHVALVKGPTGSVIYFDGQPVRSSPMGDGTITPPVGLRLGTNENGQWGAEATFDDVLVWARELPPTEIEGLFDAGNRGTVHVDLMPTEAVAAGARWRLTSGPDTNWQTTGTTLVDLPPATYTLEYKSVLDWARPSAELLTVDAGDDLSRIGVYGEVGGPILEWRLDEAAPPQALDTSGQERHGTYGGDVVVGLTGLRGLAAATAGTGTSGGNAADAITVADFGPADSYLEATVALWYRLDVIHDGYLFTWGGSYNDTNHFSAYLDPGAGLRFRVHDGADSSSTLEVSPAGFADGGWHHLALVTDGVGSRAYFDGARVASSPMGQGVVTPNDVFRVGANELGTFGIEASFDQVAVWDRAFDDVDVAGLYSSQAVVPLRIDLEPVAAVNAGGRWRLSSGADTTWHLSGETVLVEPGAHAVIFDDVVDWRTPDDALLEAELGSPIALAGIYRSLDDGELRVDLAPAAAVTGGAQWRLLDGPDGLWRSSGETILVPAGPYTLELAPAAGYLTPDSRLIDVLANDLTVEAVTYEPGGGPILYWPLDDVPGGVGQDLSGFGRDAAVGSKVMTGLGGVAGNSVQTAGQGGANGTAADGLETPDFDTADAYTEATVSLWYRLPAQPHDGYLFAWGGSNADADHLSAFLDAGTELRLRVHDSLDTTSLLSVTPAAFDNTAWHHLAMVKDGQGTRVYFDGAMVASHIMGSGTVRPKKGLFVGMSQKREFGLEATFDEVKVWDRALSQLEITNLVNATPPPTGFGGAYRTVDELDADLEQVAIDHPGIVELVDYGDSWALTNGGHTTPGGEYLVGDDLLAARVTNRAIPGTKPLFVLMACLHAREIATPELAMRFLDELTDRYGIDPDITWLVDHHEIWVLPLTNPDGHRHVELGSEPSNGARPWLWRKNVRAGGNCGWPPLDGSSTEGVDINRNFPFQWGTSSGQSGSSDPCSENFRGNGPGSEPETAAIMSLISSLIPDQRGSLITDAAPQDLDGLFIQLHSPFRTVSWPWAFTATPPPNAAGLEAIGTKVAALAGYASGQTNQAIYKMTGTADDWVYGELGAPALLFEVGEGLMPPYNRIDNILWPETRDAFVYAAKIARAPYQTSRGPETRSVVATPTAGGYTLVAVADDYDNGGQSIVTAEAYVELPPWDAQAIALPLGASDGTFDQTTEVVTGFLDTSGLASGTHLVWIRAQDTDGYWGAPSAVFVEVP